ncbi:MAG: HesA/MoeB/ThiF family protein [Bacteroidales bacterium]|nr:HesA/MoeB/ThiF family protein [Bacteroidales bacterium]
MNTSNLTERELCKYKDQISSPAIGIEGQERIKKSKVLVIGAGGKGTVILQNLATAGIGKLGISDNYLVDESCLPRQHLYGDIDLGKQKAIISQQKLVKLNHLVEYELYNVCLSNKNILTIAEPYDLIIDATDNFPAHYLINDAAVILGKPFIFGSIFNNCGVLSVFNFRNGPTLRCLYPEKPIKPEAPANEGIIYSGFLTGIVGMLMANEAIKVLLDHPQSITGQLLTFYAENYSFSRNPIESKNENLAIKEFQDFA